MRKIVLFASLLFVVLSSRSQSSVAITAGLHGASVTPHFLTYPDTFSKTPLSKVRIMVGVVANVPIKKGLFFRTGVLYSAKGSNWTQFYDTANLYADTKNLPEDDRQKLLSSNTVLNINYIDIPLNVGYKLTLKGTTKFIIGAGPQLSMLYNGNKRFNTTYVSQADYNSEVQYQYKQEVDKDLLTGNIPNRYRVVHVGANVFGGFEFSRVFLTVNYSRGLTGFYEDEERSYKHQTIGASIGIYLGKQPRTGAAEGYRKKK